MTEAILPSLRLQDAWRECERHLHHLFHALASIQSFWPITGDVYLNLSDEQIQDMDQFILRFTKLQDAMGSRLFPAILQYLEEPYEDRPMLDKLNRLEKIGFISSVEHWQTIRNIRNQFAHDYPDDPDKNAAQLNLALASASELHAMLATIGARFEAGYPMLDLGRSLPLNPSVLVTASESLRDDESRVLRNFP